MGEMEGAVVLCSQVAGLICVMDSDLCHDVSGIGVGMVPLCVTTDQLLLRIIPLLLSLLVLVLHDWNFISNDWFLKANSKFLCLCIAPGSLLLLEVYCLHYTQYVPH